MQLKENSNYKNQKLHKGYIDKNALLEMTDGGLDYYKVILKSLNPATPDRMENTLNVFRGEQNASLSIYKKGSKWLFNDFGDADWSGDVFKFAALVNELDVQRDFRQVCEHIVDVLDIDTSEMVSKGLTEDEYLTLGMYKFLSIPADKGGGYETAYSFYRQYGVTENILREYNVKAVERILYKENDGTSIIPKPHDGILICYSSLLHAKVYSPSPKKFFHVGEKPTDFIFGWYQILNRNAKYKNRDTLIITGGEKDVLTLTAMGYDAICLNSETSSIPLKAITDIFPSYKKVVVLYDIDEPGRKASKKLCNEHSLCECVLPDSLKKQGGKDVSDYVKMGFDTDKLIELITESVTSAELNEPVNSYKSDPLFDTGIYEQLPATFKEICSHFDEYRSKDVVLLSSLTALSTCFPNVCGVYRDEVTGLNLYTFIAAPASSGKGVAKFGGKLVDKIQAELIEENALLRRKYELQLNDYQKSKDKDNVSAPYIPPQRVMLIPADSSSSKVVEILGDNKNFGLMFETEADTLSNVIKSDWGDFSSTLRKAFHHERISLARKSGNGYYSVQCPQLSVLLTGTPKQITTLIDDVENGFFSRFLYYHFNQTTEWSSPFGRHRRNLDNVFEVMASKVLRWWKIQIDVEQRTEVNFTPEQEMAFHDFYIQKTEEISELLGEEAVANVRRMALSNYRLCMLLSVIRHLEKHESLPTHLSIDDADFEVARKIMKVLFVHLESVFKLVKGDAVRSKLSNQENRLYVTLPNSFTTSELKEIARKLELPPATYEKYIRKMIKVNLLMRPKHGEYEKVA